MRIGMGMMMCLLIVAMLGEGASLYESMCKMMSKKIEHEPSDERKGLKVVAF